MEERDERFFHAHHHARFFSNDLQGLSDSIVYSVPDSLIYMYHNPVLWSDAYQLTASTIEIKTDGREVLSVALDEAAFIVSEEDTLGYNQMKGRNMLGHFRDNELWRVDVDGNSQTIFFIRDEDGELIGINKAISSDVVIFVEGREVTGIQFVRQPEATLYPPEDIPQEERLLDNFQWQGDRRPRDKWDIFEWR